MAIENIIDNNRVISEFMDYHFLIPDTYCTAKTLELFAMAENKPHELQFHRSFDWLMPVIEKIEKLNSSISHLLLDNQYCTKLYHFDKFNECDFQTKTHKTEEKIDSLYLVVIDFINWYNLNNIK